MSSPFSPDQLSAEMQARYGLDRRSSRSLLALSSLALFLLVTVATIGLVVDHDSNTFQILRWSVVADDRTDVTFSVVPSQNQELVCALRAQDPTRVDVGYAIVPVPTGDSTLILNYSLRTVTNAHIVEMLDCGPPSSLRAPGPQFPPGIAPPEQPWQSSSD